MLNYQCCLNMEPLPVLIEAAQESCHSRYIALKSVLPDLPKLQTNQPQKFPSMAFVDCLLFYT